MALLRQCLQEVRMRHHEWDVREADWPEPTWLPPALESACRPNERDDASARGASFHAGLTADPRHLN
jgi:hypothetical protein